MSGPWVVGELAAWLAAMALLGFGAVVSVGYRWLRPRLHDLAPEARERLLVALAASPWVLALVSVLACFLPSLADWLGFAADHCLDHAAHHAHLCFHHAGSLERSAIAGALGGLVLVGLLGSLVAGARSWWRYVRLVGGLEALSSEGAEPGVYRVATRRLLAITLGILSPRIFLSEGLEEGLDPEDRDSVMAHERGHVHRRDGFRKLLVSALSVPWLPPARAGLLEDHSEACEQCCDLMAAEAVGDPAPVAKALLAMTRLAQADQVLVPGPVCRFGPSHVTRRVRALLEPRWSACPAAWWRGLGAGLVLVLGTGLLASGPMHHAAETALAALF